MRTPPKNLTPSTHRRISMGRMVKFPCPKIWASAPSNTKTTKYDPSPIWSRARTSRLATTKTPVWQTTNCSKRRLPRRQPTPHKCTRASAWERYMGNWPNWDRPRGKSKCKLVRWERATVIIRRIRILRCPCMSLLRKNWRWWRGTRWCRSWVW